jgi:hypothetical protein
VSVLTGGAAAPGELATAIHIKDIKTAVRIGLIVLS